MKLKQLGMMLVLMAMVALTAAFSGCSSLPAEQDKIAAACDLAAGSLEAITQSTKLGKTDKSVLKQAVDIYDVAVIPYCHPIAPSLSNPQWDKLEDALFKLAILKKGKT